MFCPPPTAGDIIILHKRSKNHNHMRYSSWYTEWDRQKFLSFWTIFCHFTLLTTKKIKFKNNEKSIWRCHFTQVYQKPQSRASWDMEFDRHNVFSFWAIFCPFTPLLTPKIKIWNKCIKNLEIIFYYTSIPQIKILWSMVPEI